MHTHTVPSWSSLLTQIWVALRHVVCLGRGLRWLLSEALLQSAGGGQQAHVKEVLHKLVMTQALGVLSQSELFFFSGLGLVQVPHQRPSYGKSRWFSDHLIIPLNDTRCCTEHSG